MRITENINMKSAYAGLAVVRGYMPSADTVKSWTIEPIKSTWSKPTGKAVFIAAGVMGTLAIAYAAVKTIRWALQKPIEQGKPKVVVFAPNNKIDEGQLYLELLEKFSGRSIKALNEIVERNGLSDTPIRKAAQNAASDLLEIEVGAVCNYNLGNTTNQSDLYRKVRKEYKNKSLADCVDRFQELADIKDASTGKSSLARLKRSLKALQDLIKEKTANTF